MSASHSHLSDDDPTSSEESDQEWTPMSFSPPKQSYSNIPSFPSHLSEDETEPNEREAVRKFFLEQYGSIDQDDTQDIIDDDDADDDAASNTQQESESNSLNNSSNPDHSLDDSQDSRHFQDDSSDDEFFSDFASHCMTFTIIQSEHCITSTLPTVDKQPTPMSSFLHLLSRCNVSAFRPNRKKQPTWNR
eukprot:TRINITY_DN6713_c0_g1_i2.p1 TRINITY_DN6713_c0_g1~~TRINITY_DN6713_c0_g1_i2.p1  ORF type:complete len:190 (-),score=39.42 TRINITY_DN6713_c0_g1_i2:603-1172(-)